MQMAKSDSASGDGSSDPSTLSPLEFESLVGRLFESLGFSIEQTQGSWDGGVDCVAVDPRPLVGGRILIQAKRFAGTVDVSVVRDLYGLVVSQGASKGVVVTTGSFGPTSREFVRGKPLELIDGVQLRDLLSALAMDAPGSEIAAPTVTD
jgi:restriction system protein